MIELIIQNKVVNLPENWDEVNAKVLVALGEVYFKPHWSDLDKLCHVVVKGCGLQVSKYQFFKKQKIDWKYIAGQLIDNGIFEKLIFLLGAPDCDQQYFPLIDTWRYTFYGLDCSNAPLQYIRVKEWMDADQTMQECFDLINEKVEESVLEMKLNALVGILFRRHGHGAAYDKLSKDFKGDEREPYSDVLHLNGYYAKKISKIPFGKKAAILLWYWSCSRWMAEEYKLVYDGGGNGGDSHPADLVLSVAECGIFGNIEAVQNAYVHDVMLHLQRCIREAKKNERHD